MSTALLGGGEAELVPLIPGDGAGGADIRQSGFGAAAEREIRQQQDLLFRCKWAELPQAARYVCGSLLVGVNLLVCVYVDHGKGHGFMLWRPGLRNAVTVS